MRTVAAHAALSLDRGVLVDKWPTHLRVALGADQIRVISGAQVALLESAVHVMAICALDQAFIDLVVEWHIECRLGVGVALEAKSRLRSLEQRFFLAAVNAVATGAADVGLGVRRTHEIRMRAGVTAQAFGVDFFARSLGGIEDLGYIAAAGYMFAACAMAVLAGHAIRVPVHECHLGVWIGGEVFGLFGMAGGASVSTDKFGVRGRSWRCGCRRGRICRRSLRFSSRRTSDKYRRAKHAGGEQEHQRRSRSPLFAGRGGMKQSREQSGGRSDDRPGDRSGQSRYRLLCLHRKYHHRRTSPPAQKVMVWSGSRSVIGITQERGYI